MIIKKKNNRIVNNSRKCWQINSGKYIVVVKGVKHKFFKQEKERDREISKEKEKENNRYL